MIVFIVFQTPILAATTYAANNNGRFIVVRIICAAVLQGIATEKCFFMAINTRLETANRPGRGRSMSLQSHFYSLIFYCWVKRERMSLHMTAEIAESLLQSSLVQNVAIYNAAKNNILQRNDTITCSCRKNVVLGQHWANR